MRETKLDKPIIFFFRIAMGWVFLYAASHQVFDPEWSVAGFLGNTKTFHDFFAVFTTPAVAPVTTFLVEYGHLLIGLALITGLLVRIAACFGALLMVLYWMAHMDWPYISNTNNFILDDHIVYAVVLVYLIAKRAGHVWGLDGWLAETAFLKGHTHLRPLFG